MALTAKRTEAAANAACDAFAALLNTGYLRIYDSTGGTGQPATPSTVIGSQVLLAELRFDAAAFGAAVAGVATAAAIVTDALANNTGTATWFRALASNGTTAVYDGSVGTSGCDLNLNTTAIVQNTPVYVTSLTLTEATDE